MYAGRVSYTWTLRFVVVPLLSTTILYWIQVPGSAVSGALVYAVEAPVQVGSKAWSLVRRRSLAMTVVPSFADAVGDEF